MEILVSEKIVQFLSGKRMGKILCVALINRTYLHFKYINLFVHGDECLPYNLKTISPTLFLWWISDVKFGF